MSILIQGELVVVIIM